MGLSVKINRPSQAPQGPEIDALPVDDPADRVMVGHDPQPLEASQTMSFAIRPLAAADRLQWGQLWQGYLRFYESEVPADVTHLTWTRILDPEAPILGLCAATSEGNLLGIVHHLFHPVSWAAGPRCYLEDLFTAPEARGQGVGRALIEAVYAAADARGGDQVYWLTQEFNATARKLYDQVAKATPFIKYRR